MNSRQDEHDSAPRENASQEHESLETQILRSWHINASPWSRAIRSASIISRELVTNAAILEAVGSVFSQASAAQRKSWRVLDVGCGEGWLTRALSSVGMRVLGIDAVPALVDDAQKSGGGDFQVLAYAAIARREWRGGPFDAAVCNFSLLGAESVESLVAGLAAYLADPGYLIIQTLHPIAACGDAPYTDGWRAGNWCGFSNEFVDPAPWYFRTIETWQSLLKRCGFDLLETREPQAAGATAPASIIWICKPRVTEQT
jgi:2-polyprenyl-3-methyl-5-hydroxy-6-metoxy-1,4-benzoquinol methylase